MARRVVYVGGLEDLERVRAEYSGRLVPGDEYTFGRYCQATEESDLLWEDLRRAFRRAKLTSRERYAVAKAIQLIPYAEIARQTDVDESTVRQTVERGFVKLDSLSVGNLGCWTQIVESCGGWAAVSCYVAEIDL